MAVSSTSYQSGQSGNYKGRPKGSRNKASAAREQLMLEKNITPLEFMLMVLGDETMPLSERKWAAEKAAPYIHPRIAIQEEKGMNSDEMTHDEWIELLSCEDE